MASCYRLLRRSAYEPIMRRRASASIGLYRLCSPNFVPQSSVRQFCAFPPNVLQLHKYLRPPPVITDNEVFALDCLRQSSECRVGAIPWSGSLRDEEITGPAQFSVEEYNTLKNNHLRFARVVKVVVQPLSGFMYYITLETMDGSEQKKYFQAKVYRNAVRGSRLELHLFRHLLYYDENLSGPDIYQGVHFKEVDDQKK